MEKFGEKNGNFIKYCKYQTVHGTLLERVLELLLTIACYFCFKINGVQVVKSGTDFRELSCITVSFNDDNTFSLDVKRIEITSDITEDPEVKLTVDKFVGELKTSLNLHF